MLALHVTNTIAHQVPETYARCKRGHLNNDRLFIFDYYIYKVMDSCAEGIINTGFIGHALPVTVTSYQAHQLNTSCSLQPPATPLL